jgi:thiol:disulfide interchange protein
MKKLSLILVLFFTALGTQAQQYPWRELTYQEALQQAESKLILLEFYTDW